MRIALVSYEFPPQTGGGGIGTYLVHVRRMLVERGHAVEIFAGAGAGSEGTIDEDDGLVHRGGATPSEFLTQVGPKLASRHCAAPFDVTEAPEYLAQSVPSMKYIPDVPLVVKLHTPSFVVRSKNWTPPSRKMRWRRWAGAIMRLHRPTHWNDPGRYDASADPERVATAKADLVAAPSRAIADLVREEWSIPSELVTEFPLPFQPNEVLTRLQAPGRTQTVVFVGRLEVRKGILELLRAIPFVLRTRPQTTFRFVGSAHPSPDGRGSMQDYLLRKLCRYKASLNFMGEVPPARLVGIFDEADICVFPSRWESFGYVCLEAMAAARGVIGSWNGGMAELLDGGCCGILINPDDPRQIADAILSLFDDSARRAELGRAARERVLTEYSFATLGPVYESAYRQAIENRRLKAVTACLN